MVRKTVREIGICIPEKVALGAEMAIDRQRALLKDFIQNPYGLDSAAIKLFKEELEALDAAEDWLKSMDICELK